MTTTKVQLTFPTQAKENITQALFSMRESIIEDNPELGDDFEEMDEVMENMDLIIEMTIKVMGKHLSDEEIHFLNDLYTNPLLLSIMSKYPAMVKDAIEAGKEMAHQEFLMENH